MKITQRRVLSVEDATAKLDVLARRYGIASPQYDDIESDSMSEFDALTWTSLCSQRTVLQRREMKTAPDNGPVPPRFLGIYETKRNSPSILLKNTDDGQLSLAA